MNHDLGPWHRSATDVDIDGLIDAQHALQQGRYGVARRQLLPLASDSRDDDLRTAARKLLRSLSPDPVALVVWSLLLCLILALLIVYVAL